MVNLKEELLLKSNSYKYYKENNEKLIKENELLKKDIEMLKNEIETLKNSNPHEAFNNNYRKSMSFCNGAYIEYFLREDFEDKLKEVTKNLSPYTKKAFKRYYLRALAVASVRKENFFYPNELESQEEHTKFYQENKTEDGIAGYKFSGKYNLGPFINLFLRDVDLDYIKDKDIIDAGAFTGDTSIPLSKITSGNIYAFEPFDESFELLNKNIKDNNIENIKPVKKSLGNMNGERSLFLSGDNTQGITSDASFRQYDKEIKVEETTIDTFVEENNLNVGYITVDVEGAELDLLNGAINTIKTQKPILRISMYHRVTDYFEIIPWVVDLDLGYEFEIIKEEPWTFLADIVVHCRAKK